MFSKDRKSSWSETTHLSMSIITSTGKSEKCAAFSFLMLKINDKKL